MTEDEKTDALLRQIAAEEYNRPPHIVPREQMWDAVRQGLATGTAGTGNGERGTGNRDNGVLRFGSRVPRWVYLAAAAVALLAVGIQVGRMMGPSDAFVQAPPTVNPDSLGPDSTVAPLREPDRNVAQVDRTDNRGRPRPRPEPERLNPNADDDAAASAYSVVAAQHLTEAEAMLTIFKGDVSRGNMDDQFASWGKDLLSNTRLLLGSPAARDPARRRLLQDLELVLVQIVQLSPRAPARDRELINGALTDDQVLTRLRTAIPLLYKGT